MGSLILRARELALATLAELPRRQAHVAGVARAAAEVVGKHAFAEQDEIIAAAWLHDIGYAEPLNRTGFHPVDGARFLRDSSFPELVVSLETKPRNAALSLSRPSWPRIDKVKN